MDNGAGQETVFAGGSAISATVIKAPPQPFVIDDGATTVGTPLSLNGGPKYVYSGGTVSNTVVVAPAPNACPPAAPPAAQSSTPAASEHVFSGGTAISATISNGGYQVIRAGGTASFTTLSNGASRAGVVRALTASFTTQSATAAASIRSTIAAVRPSAPRSMQRRLRDGVLRRHRFELHHRQHRWPGVCVGPEAARPSAPRWTASVAARRCSPVAPPATPW